MKKELLISITSFFLLVFFSSCDTGGTGAESKNNCVDGIDTTKYKTIYEKNGALILVLKDKGKEFVKTDPIDPDVAVSMIGTHVKPDVDAARKLGAQITRYVDFNIEKLITFYAVYKSKGMAPDSLRIYFGVYDNNAPEHRYDKRMTCILAGVKNKTDIFVKADKDLWPVNIGTLCPPDCDNDDFNDETKGAIFIKKGGKAANAISW